MKTVFLRALEADDKADALRITIREPLTSLGRQRFEIDAYNFAAVPRSPFAYWVSDAIRQVFKNLPAFEAEERSTKQGLATADDFRFVRGWWAVPPRGLGERWVSFAKGGQFSPFYADVHLVVNWEKSGIEIKNNLNERGTIRSNVWMLRDTASNYFLRPGLTWPLRTQGGLSVRSMPGGCIFGHKGPTAFIESDDGKGLLALLGIMNSQAFRALVGLQMAFGSYEVGVIQRTPIPRMTSTDLAVLARLARRACLLKRSLDTTTEASHAMTLPAVLQVSGDDLSKRAAAWNQHVHATELELKTIQAETDARCFDLYGIVEADRRAITDVFGGGNGTSAELGEIDSETDADDEVDTESGADVATLAADLVSWAVGVAFGRFDIRLATGVRPLPEDPEPFDSRPVCSPAILIGEDGLPVTRVPAGYPVPSPETGILVDDRGDARDLYAAVRSVFGEVFGIDADAWWSEVGLLLAPQTHDLRHWIAESFFEHHLKQHSKSRRRAPILWQLALPSARYSVWLYAHRLTQDSLFRVQNEIVTPKLAHEERQLSSLIQGAGPNPSAKERKEIAEQEAFVEELRSLLDEVKRAASLWRPALDDGVMLTMAPLWRLVPQHRPWQKELKNKWDELVAGKYDWSRTAMHLWPERVVPKCAADRSLAIAHRLDDVFWAEADDGTYGRRQNPTRTITDLVHERNSVAVKAALKGLTEGSAPSNQKTRTRRSTP
jgi:hypothetical protein